MIQGMYNAFSGMMASNARMNITSNNIANVTTPGYQAKTANQVSAAPGGARINNVGTSTANGYLIPTGRPLDLAITGEGFFQVQQNGQTALTRNGSFTQDAGGNIVDNLGRTLIQNAPQGAELSATSDGFLTADGEPFARIPIADQFGQPMPANSFNVETGFLEASNVDAAREIVDSMTNLRSFQMNARTVTATDEMLGALVDMVA